MPFPLFSLLFRLVWKRWRTPELHQKALKIMPHLGWNKQESRGMKSGSKSWVWMRFPTSTAENSENFSSEENNQTPGNIFIMSVIFKCPLITINTKLPHVQIWILLLTLPHDLCTAYVIIKTWFLPNNFFKWPQNIKAVTVTIFFLESHSDPPQNTPPGTH